MSDSLKEKILFKKLAKQDKAAFVEFYDKYFDQIYRYVYFKVGSREEAEDLTSALFLKLWNSVREGKVSDHLTLKAFVYTIARNLVIDHYRKKQTVATVAIYESTNAELGEEQGIEIIDGSVDVREQIDLDMEVDLIKAKMMLLKDEYREVIIWKYFDEMSTDEIAQLLGKPKANVRVLSHRALKALKELVEGEKNKK